MCLWRASCERGMTREMIEDQDRPWDYFGRNLLRKESRSLAEIWTRIPNMRIRSLVITSVIPFVSSPDPPPLPPPPPSSLCFAVIHIKGTTVNETKAKRTAATLGNFVVKVALRITDARQEVGTAEAARGPWHGGREGQGGGRGRRCIVGVSGRAKWKKKRHYANVRGPSDAFTRLLLFSLTSPPSLPRPSLPHFIQRIARNVGAYDIRRVCDWLFFSKYATYVVQLRLSVWFWLWRK